MPKRKVYTIGQIVDAFYKNEKPEKVKKMAETLLTKKSKNKKIYGKMPEWPKGTVC